MRGLGDMCTPIPPRPEGTSRQEHSPASSVFIAFARIRGIRSASCLPPLLVEPQVSTRLTEERAKLYNRNVPGVMRKTGS
jgi:hypothetical protein